MADLLDVNVWLPLSAPDHPHHARSRRYWQDESADSVAFCRVTALALLRHLTNPRIMAHAVLTGVEAWRAYERWIALPEVSLAVELADLDQHLAKLARAVDLTPTLWTDAYIAAFAIGGGHRVVTFDGDFRRFPDLDLLHLQA